MPRDQLCHKIRLDRNMYVMPPPYSSLSDEDLLAAAVCDAEAFGLFYDRFEKSLLAYFMRATRRSDLAADLMAEAFAAALGSAASFRPELRSARAWLFGIARHTLADAWEHRRVEDGARRRLGMEPLELTDAELERVEELGSSDPRTLELLRELPVDQRRAVEGRVLEERDYAELAAQMACSQSVVRQRVSRGLRSIRERLESAQAAEEAL